MELKPILDTTQALLREGDTGKALQTLLSALAQNPRYVSTVRTLQVLEGNYNAVRQQELKGILSFQEAQRSYSQVNDALLSILNDLHSGRVPHVHNRSNRMVWLVIGVLLLLGGVGGFLYSTAVKGKMPGADCVEFRDSGPKVLILPFKNVGEGQAKPEYVIQSRIQTLSNNKNFPVAAEILTKLTLTSFNANGTRDAETLAHRCGADMVVWGYYDRSDSLRIDLRFMALRHPGSAFETGFQAFRNLPDVQSGRLLTRLDDAIFGVCGILAVRTGNAEIARTWFGKMQEKGEVVQAMEKILDE